VKIHGNYCGPNWTHGRAVPAKDYFKYPEVQPIDALDTACQAHDKDCSHGGCSQKGDLALRDVALAVAITSPDMQLRATAALIAAAMEATAPTRRR
jgi:hypothetical protein